MKAQDLRIGNIIHNPIQGVDFKVDLQTIGNIFYDNILGRDVTYRPIPITEEWLIKLGFKEVLMVDDIYGYFYVSNKYQFIYVNNGQIRFNCEEDGVILLEPNCLDSVHQLQNLYHSLTGTELNG